jgi:hypothetical protein
VSPGGCICAQAFVALWRRSCARVVYRSHGTVCRPVCGVRTVAFVADGGGRVASPVWLDGMEMMVIAAAAEACVTAVWLLFISREPMMNSPASRQGVRAAVMRSSVMELLTSKFKSREKRTTHDESWTWRPRRRRGAAAIRRHHVKIRGRLLALILTCVCGQFVAADSTLG